MPSMFFEQLGVPPPPNPELLEQIFGLSPAEITLAIFIARGEPLKRIASELKLSHATVRNRLKTVFAKTDTHRQSELAVLLLRATKSA